MAAPSRVTIAPGPPPTSLMTGAIRPLPGTRLTLLAAACAALFMLMRPASARADEHEPPSASAAAVVTGVGLGLGSAVVMIAQGVRLSENTLPSEAAIAWGYILGGAGLLFGGYLSYRGMADAVDGHKQAGLLAAGTGGVALGMTVVLHRRGRRYVNSFAASPLIYQDESGGMVAGIGIVWEGM